MTHIDESLTAKGYTPASSVPATFGMARTVKSITIHHWGALGQTHDGVNNFFVNGPGATSAHFVASAGRINCLVNPDDAAWHAGNGRGNATSIGIECRPEATDGDYATVAELIRYLRGIYGNLPLIPHRDWQATACPGVWDLARLDRMARTESETIQVQSSTTTPTPTASEEDELAFTIEQLLNHAAYDGGPTVSQVLKNLDDSEVTRYLKGSESDTLYDVTDSGKLRPIILAEWQATGRPYRTLPQVIINALPKTS